MTREDMSNLASQETEDTFETRVPEREAMDDAQENAAYDRIASRWLNKLIYPALVKELNPTAARRVLDVCSGSGRLSLALARMLPAATVCGVDLSDSMLELARENVRTARLSDRLSFRAANIQATPFEDGRFDAAIGYGALHHWEDPTAVFAELVRVVRPGGQIVIGDWRRDRALARFFSARQGTLESSLIDASIRAAYRVDEMRDLLKPVAGNCRWDIKVHPMGILIRGHVLAVENS